MDKDQVAEIIISILRYRYGHDIQNTDRQRQIITEYLTTGKAKDLYTQRKYYVLIRQLETEVMEILRNESVSNLSESI